MLKIGLISDTHHKVDVANSAIEYLKNKKVDLILHAGDIVELAILKTLKRSKIPYYAVLGNNDAALRKYKDKFELFEEPFRASFDEIRFALMHYPYYFDNSVDMVVYGHTHYFVSVLKDNTLYINPGEICGRKKPLYEFAYVIYDENFSVFKVSSKVAKKLKWVEEEINL